MKVRKIKRLLLIVPVVVFSVVASAKEPVSRYELKVGDFDELKVVDGINVEYVCDQSRAGLVEFETTRDLASAVIFEPSKGRLSVRLASRENPYTGLPTVRVYSSQLTAISNEGDSLVRVASLPQAVRFSCRVMGNGSIEVGDVCVGNLKGSILSGCGKIRLSGRCDAATFKVAGAGTINAVDLESVTLNCTLAGTGTINCHPTKMLEVGGLGGTVNYVGDPEVKKRFLTTVKLKPIK